MARTLTKPKALGQIFLDEVSTAISKPDHSHEKSFDDEIWLEKPVCVEEFCEKYIGEKLFPVQAGFAEEMTGTDPMVWSNKYEGGVAYWGKGSGKDRTIAKIQLYVKYKLLCMKNPQRTLREVYGCSIGDEDAIDCGNMSINARQALSVYFKKFKSMLLMVNNPNTGMNWFAEKGVDLREGYDIQAVQVIFPHNITAHSLNSETNTGEGLNLFFVTIDEFGTFPAEKGFELLDAVQDTATSRFQDFSKVCVISYKYHHNDPMDILYNKEKNNPKMYTSRASTWEVNIGRSKKDFASRYFRNPEKAEMTYECKGGVEQGGYVTKKYMISRIYDYGLENPIKGDLVSIDSSHLNSLIFKEWFKGKPGVIYAVHVDLAKGKVDDRGDAAGLSLVHPEKIIPKIDSDLKKSLASEGIVIYDIGLETAKKGMVVDLSFQLVARKVLEVEFAEIRKFIMMLRSKYKFDIRYVTYDGYQSTESIQILNNNGINADVLSVDKDNKSYDLWKELMYQQIFKSYPNEIAKREYRELMINDRGLVDHPEKSWDREIAEGIDKGSKDVTDSQVGATKTAYDNIPVDVGVYFG
jgi:hypothetical protein